MTHQAEDEAREERIAMEIAVPLRQLEGVQVDEKTQQAIEDWHLGEPGIRVVSRAG